MSVYVVVSGDKSAIKIGFSTDVRQRVLAVNAGNLHGATLLHEFPGGRNTEAWMHAKFREFRIRGEWFHWNTASQLLLDELRETGIPDLDIPDLGAAPSGQVSPGLASLRDLSSRLAHTIDLLASAETAGAQKARGEIEQSLQILFSAGDPSAERYEAAFLAMFPAEDRWWRIIKNDEIVRDLAETDGKNGKGQQR